ncbi:hypothetical protein LOC51_43390 [Rubrivivax sp. JA1024]|nr:hypothetical protein [Rubrivivax sp. JA1024]
MTENHHHKDKYSESEAEQRFGKLVKQALNTRPKPLKIMGPKGVPAQSKKGKVTRSSNRSST